MTDETYMVFMLVDFNQLLNINKSHEINQIQNLIKSALIKIYLVFFIRER